MANQGDRAEALARLQASVRAAADRTLALRAGPEDETLQPGDSSGPDVRVGDTIEGRWRIEAGIGQGAFGRVFRARDLIVTRDVAVKFVVITSEAQLEQHEHELAALRRARVPGVVALWGDGRHGPWAYLVMELVSGRAFPGAGAAEPEDAGEAFLRRSYELMRAVQRLHRVGVLHRDLKPANILVEDSGRVTLVDLGIAEDEAQGESRREAARLLGTPRYMAPERIAGAPATRATDVFAIGMTLLQGAAHAGMSLPTPLATLIDRMIAADPAIRVAALDEAVDHLRTRLGIDERVVLPPEHLVLRRLSLEDLESLVATSNRIFLARDVISRLLLRRTAGDPALVVAEIADWIERGLVRWDGRLRVDPRSLEQLLAEPTLSSVAVLPGDVDGLSALAMDAWALLTVAQDALACSVLARATASEQVEIDREIETLVDAGFVLREPGSTVRAVRPCPAVLATSAGERRPWAERLAPLVPADSLGAFHLAVAAGKHERACEVALVLADASDARGDDDRVRGVLDHALALTRQHPARTKALLEPLLLAAALLALRTATVSAVENVRRHVEVADGPSGGMRAVGDLMAAAGRVLVSDPAGALARLDGLAGMPTSDHERLVHIVANLAALRTRSPEEQRRRALAAARWARRSARPSDRARSAAWTGWLRFHEERFGSAAGLHTRAARRIGAGRLRVTALCNAATASIEACRLTAARDLAREALLAAEVSRDVMNALRAERALRVVEYRRGIDHPVDDELIDAARGLEGWSAFCLVALNEAAFAWRAEDMRRAAELSAEVLGATGGAGAGALRALARGVASLAQGRVHADLEDTLRGNATAATPLPPGIHAQLVGVSALLGSRDCVSSDVRGTVLSWAHAAAAPSLRRELLSPAEVSSALQ